MRHIVSLAAFLFAAAPASATETEIKLKPAPGLEQVENNCGSCHTLDYIQMNAPFPNAALWEAEMAKMIKVFGAPVEDKDAKIILDYLKANYGS